MPAGHGRCTLGSAGGARPVRFRKERAADHGQALTARVLTPASDGAGSVIEPLCDCHLDVAERWLGSYWDQVVGAASVLAT